MDNDYPPYFIRKYMNRFFHVNQATAVIRQGDPVAYERLHSKLLEQPTRREKLLNERLKDPIKSPAALQTKLWNSNVLYPRYLFDKIQSRQFAKLFYGW